MAKADQKKQASLLPERSAVEGQLLEVRNVPPLGALRVMGDSVVLVVEDTDAQGDNKPLPVMGSPDMEYVRVTVLGGDAHIRLGAADDVAELADFPMVDGDHQIFACDDHTYIAARTAIGSRRARIIVVPVQTA